ncbi:hypothetical protein [Prochlorococcus marinus]|uniref:Uncharacterized protein n=1 Tax=Prochlorococcus marinus XMU1408 TaxID=2213228 RepID=A0A318R6S7_PROMR|nr:hypothetical protein [Prochlorococcus marinus]MBW3042063.1 hypothetical protein [Prochlorococcus marinus str. XMU1408]PYE03181.1 hypothetical protein DNJ73_05440 [Prochlorococcus marinus XMU1408]
MSRYYCPFCSSRYQLTKTRRDGVLICGQCDEPLIKSPLINSKKIFGLVAASAFLAPLLIMILFVIEEINTDEFPTNSEPLVRLSFK